MKILAIDSSAKSCSVCINDNEKIVSAFYINAGLTHSRTLLPMIDSALKTANLSIDDIDLFACANGPGSYTGLRIGISTIKGLAAVKGKKCLGISTLHGLAFNLIQCDCIACCVMDARCNQVYTASFDIQNGEATRLSDDEAISIDELGKKLETFDKKVIFVGDGAEICHQKLGYCIAEEEIRFQNAKSIAKIALQNADKSVSAAQLNPIYLRLPQAERELRARNKNNGSEK